METAKRKEESQTHFFSLFVIFILGCAIYSNVLQGEFVSDDFINVVDNAAIRHITQWPAIWQSFNTRFLVGITFALNYALDGLNVQGYHLFNIIVHISNAILVYWFVILSLKTPTINHIFDKRRIPSIALFAALIFLCHPIQTQGVSFITQRAVSMATFFYSATLIFYIQARLTNKKRLLGMAGLTMVLGLLSKEVLLTLPVTLCLYEFAFFGNSRESFRERLCLLLPFFALALLLPMILWLDREGSMLSLKGQISNRKFNILYFLTEINVLRTYLSMLVFPVNQRHEYDYRLVTELWELRTVVSFVLLMFLLVLAFRLWKTKRLMSFCIFWFFITTSVEIAVVSVINRALLYEHWLYLPMVGFSIFISLALSEFFVDIRSYKRVMTAVVVLLCLLTYQRNLVWQKETYFWEDNKEKSPGIPHVYLGAGSAYQRKKMYRQAYENYQQALSFYQRGREQRKQLNFLGEEFFSRLYNNLGVVSFMMHKDDEMFGYFANSLKLDPNNAATYNNLGNVHYQLKNYREAINSFDKAIEIRGDYPDAYRYVGLSYFALGEKPTAAKYLQKARELFKKEGHTSRVDEISKFLVSF